MAENQNLSPDLSHDQVLLEWKTPEFIPHPKGARWFLIFGVLILSLTAYAVWSGSATMAIVFILLAGMVTLTHNQEPKIITIQITQMGVRIANRFYPYTALKAYWIIYNLPFINRLYLRLANKSGAEIKIELNEQSPIQVRQLLARELPEIEGGEEHWTDLLIRILRLQ